MALFSWSHTHSTTALTLGRKVQLSRNRWNFLTPGWPLCRLHPLTSTGVRRQFRSLIRALPPGCVRKRVQAVDRWQYCPEHLVLLTSNHEKTIWHGHAPMDINNWKVSWSYQVYVRETRATRGYPVIFSLLLLRNISPSSLMTSTTKHYKKILSSHLPCSIHFST